jgi:alkanesulfonate monooxygenase SsuD/methylene tetrahydromethanopterin reductase-like flavin-dependent oxidoreductase (luciferase family)
MRLGMFMMPVHPPDRTFWSTLEEDREKSVLADALGFDEVWLGEHFSATTEPIPSPLMFFAGLLRHTKNIAFGTAVINLPNHHPAIVAAEAAQFDHMSKGRFMLGVGAGGLVSDIELFNNPDVHARNRMVIEAVDFIQRIWSQDPPYDLRGEFWQMRIKDGIIPELGVGFMPKPYQTPGPPISISVASPNSSSARTAALKGWGMISANIIPIYSVARPAAKPGFLPAARTGGSRAMCWWHRRTPRHMTAYSASTAPTGISTPICARFSAGSGTSRCSSRARTCRTRRPPWTPSPGNA